MNNLQCQIIVVVCKYIIKCNTQFLFYSRHNEKPRQDYEDYTVDRQNQVTNIDRRVDKRVVTLDVPLPRESYTEPEYNRIYMNSQVSYHTIITTQPILLKLLVNVIVCKFI